MRFTLSQLVLLLMIYSGGALNNRPVIGIVSEQVWGKNESYIASSYVKFVESAGARVIPILSNSSAEQLGTVFSLINGVLFPGGGVSLDSSNYGHAGSVIYDLAKKANDGGDFFPLWGTCLGFELLGYLSAGKDSSVLASGVDAENLSLALNFSSGAESSRLYAGFSPEDMKSLSEEALTFNNHKMAITVSTFNARPDLNQFYNVLSTNRDRGGLEFVSSMEAQRYPFYAVQWHPEKSGFEWNTGESINHSQHAVRAMQLMANFFVSEARRSKHTFSDQDIKLIYSYTPTFTGSKSFFEQKYYF